VMSGACFRRLAECACMNNAPLQPLGAKGMYVVFDPRVYAALAVLMFLWWALGDTAELGNLRVARLLTGP
jgi:hypothetical protein